MKKLKVNKDNLLEVLDDAMNHLLEMAKKMCWNKISKNCKYIISEIDESNESGNYFENIKTRNANNQKKEPTSLKEAVHQLHEIYPNLYDINLFIWKAKKNETIIDIRYFPKSFFEIDYRNKIINDDPMLHCKIAIPLYRKSDSHKFDVNWELGGIRHKWKLFYHRTISSKRWK